MKPVLFKWKGVWQRNVPREAVQLLCCHGDTCWTSPMALHRDIRKNSFWFSAPMSVVRGSTPTAAPVGKRCPEGTSASSVSICSPVKGTKGCAGCKTHLTLQQMTQHLIIHQERSSNGWEPSFLLPLIRAGWLPLLPFIILSLLSSAKLPPCSSLLGGLCTCFLTD